MKINQLVILVEKKIKEAVDLEQIFIEDKSFLHKNHKGNDKDKFHLKITVKSKKLKSLNKVEANKIIYKSISDELKTHIHSIQLSINQ